MKGLKGANPNLFDHYNQTPLYIVLARNDFSQCDVEAVKLLLKNKAELNVEPSKVNYAYIDGNCLYSLCQRHEYTQVVLDFVQFLIDNGAIVNFCNQSAIETPLMRACIESSNDSAIHYVELLIRNKANVHWLDQSHHTALDMLYLSHQTNPQIAKLLIKNGANYIDTYSNYTFCVDDDIEMLALLVGEIVEKETDESKINDILFDHPDDLSAQRKIVKLLKHYHIRTEQHNLLRTLSSSNGSNALEALVLTYL